MNIIFYDLIFFFISIIATIIFLSKNKKNIKREGAFILYKTKFGIRAIDKVAKKKKFLDILEKPVIVFGYLLMASGLFLLFKITCLFIKMPKELVEITRVPPVMPLIPYFTSIFKVGWLPPFYFTYWLIIIAITTISHEFLHGIFFKKNKVKIKSTGFAFLGPFLAAFVEPDEKILKRKEKKQLASIAAGSVGNLFLTFLFVLMLWAFFSVSFVEGGVKFDNYAMQIIHPDNITKISNESLVIGGNNLTKIYIKNETYFIYEKEIENYRNKTRLIAFEDSPALEAGLKGVIIQINNDSIKNIYDLKKVLKKYKQGDVVEIITKFNNSEKKYFVNLSSKNGSGYLGIVVFRSGGVLKGMLNKIFFFKKEGTYYEPKCCQGLIIFIYNLLWWAFLINFGVALFNMIPAGVFDGGRFFYITILKMTKSKKVAEVSFKVSTLIILSILFIVTFIWFFNFF